jgi:sugar (pentulose or hexulose) kinase
MSEHSGAAAEWIRSGQAILGIEFGSTRIKASLVGPDMLQLASGSHAWENRFRDGVWTYDMGDVWRGLAACYASLVEDVRAGYALELNSVAAMGVSGMMHGYLALDADGQLLVPFRTWRNTITTEACVELAPLLDFAVPQRWSIAHLYQSILEGQPHVPRIAHLTTLAGYVHSKLTGQHVMGLGDASGMLSIRRSATGTQPESPGSTPTLRHARWAGPSVSSCRTSCLPATTPAGSPPRVRTS